MQNNKDNVCQDVLFPLLWTSCLSSAMKKVEAEYVEEGDMDRNCALSTPPSFSVIWPSPSSTPQLTPLYKPAYMGCCEAYICPSPMCAFLL